MFAFCVNRSIIKKPMSKTTCRGCGIALADDWKDPCPQCGDTRRNITLSLDPLVVESSIPPVRLWQTASFARSWFDDAFQEAAEGGERHHRRREIVFAVCFAESYLFEFVRDYVLIRQYDLLFTYFPADDRRGIRERWKEVLRELHDSDLIKAIPDFRTDPSWPPFVELVKYRDGLIHAKASRPATSTQNEKEKPMPSLEDLQNLPAGWAVKTVVELVRSLHHHIGIPDPAWLVEP
jgi:hypothetical protein